MNRLLAVIALILFASVSSCSSTKPPAPEAAQGNKIIASLKDLSSFYKKKTWPGS